MDLVHIVTISNMSNFLLQLNQFSINNYYIYIVKTYLKECMVVHLIKYIGHLLRGLYTRVHKFPEANPQIGSCYFCVYGTH
jgi:hypothetical protein